MLIGWLPGDEGGGRPPAIDPRPPAPIDDDPWDQWREADAVIWHVWRTSGDERVCPVCGPLAGIEFRSDAGPVPPLHGNCRCRREVSRVEWVLRGPGRSIG